MEVEASRIKKIVKVSSDKSDKAALFFIQNSAWNYSHVSNEEMREGWEISENQNKECSVEVLQL